MQYTVTKKSRSVEETLKLGQSLAESFNGGETIALVAPLGSGKTHFVKGIAKGLGVKSHVLSPTFVLERIYKTNLKSNLHHFDVYRLSENEVIGIGLPELLGEDIVVIEWADRIKGLLPSDTIWIEIDQEGENSRIFKFNIPEHREYIYEKLR